ncbi:homing endonuclease associated repeat-containing protein [Candidatus Nanosyncoccus alces]|uniref:DNA repair helicase RadD n=1 Tax=Candidatus Nanosyncoccus alces TaxID=2171997 RepID=A0ABY0FP90_9BACT|nr:DEAD/DEAH box helicase family protein [Candidatus Nanosyncoccus alces]RYC75108.1 putative DNA repair helicase RadD [Candidatus Nanosyncoccus alces]
MDTTKPRNYQQSCLENLALAREQGANKALVVMASGLGKTLTGAFDIKNYLNSAQGTCQNRRVLILCHSEAILSQIKEVYKTLFGEEYRYGMYNGFEKATHQTDFLFANLQSVNLHKDEFDPNEFVYILVDEAHHSPAKTYRQAIEYFHPQFLLGMTATPERMDDAVLSEIFGETAFEYRLVDAVQDGWLSEVEYRVKTDELQKLETILDSGERFSLSQLNREVFVPKRDEEIVRIIREDISGKNDPTMVVFCQTIAHAEKFAELMGDAVVIHSQMSNEERNRRLKGFRSGEIKTVCAVDILNEGIDVPRTDVIVFLRVTQSKIVFTQQLGRGLRRAKGKGNVLVLDFVSTATRLEMLYRFEREFKEATGRYVRRKQTEEREYFNLDIEAPVFRERKVDIMALIERARRVSERYNSTYTDEELISLLKAFAEKRGHAPTQTEADMSQEIPASTTYVKRFGTWEAAMSLAGMKAYRSYYSDTKMIELLRNFIERLGHIPTIGEIDADETMPCSATYICHFGSIESAIKKAGYNYGRAKRKVSYEEGIVLLKEFFEKTGHPPKTTDLGKGVLPSYLFYTRKYGSWSNALALAGLGVVGKNAGYSDEEMLNLLRDKAERDGKVPSRREVEADPDMPSATTYRAHFGSWENTLRLAGLKK